MAVTLAESLNDLAVTSLPALGPTTARGLLRAADVLEPGREDVAENLVAVTALQAEGLMGRLLEAVLEASRGPDLDDNVDRLRFPGGMPGVPDEDVPRRLAMTLAQIDGFERLYGRLDAASADTMLRVLAYRILGHRKVRMPLGDAGTVRRAAALVRDALLVREATLDTHFAGWRTDLYDLAPLGVPVQLHAVPLNVINTFLVEQYAWDGPPAVGVRPGDVVVDGGGCWGDTALHFAHLAGPRGRVHVFEFEPDNLRILEANLDLNPGLRDRVDAVRHPLWDASGESVAFTSSGPGTRVGAGAGAGIGTAVTRTVDDLVEEGRIERVDFLKLDIEGAELRALRGAERTLRRDRPRLAIAAYHRFGDLVEIPAFLDRLELGYRYALGHYTIHAEETVLFAWPETPAD